jgi:hypothetical protein
MPLSLVALLALAPLAEPPPTGDAVIRGKAGKSEIVVTTTRRLAGAVHSLTWDGVEFIDSYDHGRQLQSASAFDGGRPGFHAECFNPTEAGSRHDHTGDTSSTRLLRFRAGDGELSSTARMAFWLRPGEKSDGKPALNDTAVSTHRVSKRIAVGYKTWPHALDYRVTFTVPPGEPHTFAQFEALTGYMPPAFEKFHTLDVTGGELADLSDGPGEQAKPVVFATADGKHAMGVWSPDQPSRGYEAAGYGRFRFKEEQVVKWNCVFRLKEAKGVPAGEYSFRLFVAVGTADDVRATLSAITKAEK